MNIDIEKRLLASCFYEEKTAFEATLVTDAYVEGKNALVAQAIKNLVAGANKVTVDNVVIEAGKMEVSSVVTPDLVYDIFSYYTPSDAEFLIRELMDRYKRRKLKSKFEEGMRLLDRGGQNVDNVWESVQETANTVLVDEVVETPYEISKKILKIARIRREEFKKTGIVQMLGMKSGVNALDEQLNGWRTGKFYFIGGRPGMGKTSAMLQIMDGFQKQHEGLLVSIEMSNNDIVLRLISQSIGLSSDRIESGNFEDPEKWDLLEDKVEDFKNSKIHLYKSSNNLEDIVKAIKQYKRSHNIKWVVIDYMQVMSTRKYRQKAVEKIEDIASTMMVLAKEQDVCVVMLSQVSREAEKRSPPRPKKRDMKGGGAIEENAYGMILMYRPAYYDIHEDKNGTPYPPGYTEFIIEKNRGGAENVTVKQIFEPDYTRFIDMPSEEEIPY